MEYIFWLDWADRYKGDIGRRGFLLSAAAENGLNVQRTAIVIRRAYDHFLDESGIAEDVYTLSEAADPMDEADLDRAYEEIKKRFLGAQIPWDMEMEIASIVRAIGEGAGMPKPFIGVYPTFGFKSNILEGNRSIQQKSRQPTGTPVWGLANLKEVLGAIKLSWASLFSPHAIAYRRKMGIKDTDVYPAVCIQTVSKAKESGFIDIPGKSESGNITIRALYGLTPGLFCADLVPDTYSVERVSLEVEGKRIQKQTWRYGLTEQGEVIKYKVNDTRQDKQKITDDQITILSRVAQNIVDVLGQRIEWSMDEGHVTITGAEDMPEESEAEDLGNPDEAAEATSGPAMTPAQPVQDIFGGFFQASIAPSQAQTQTSSQSPPPSGPDQPSGPLQPSAHALEVLANLNLNEDRVGTKVYLEVYGPDEVKKVDKALIDGAVILSDSFYVKAYQGTHPNAILEHGDMKRCLEELSYRLYNAAKAVEPKPLLLKLPDYASDEYLGLKGAEKYEAAEPKFLNWRGASRYIHPNFKNLFKAELGAIVGARRMGCQNIGVMVPFVRTPSEFKRILEMVRAAESAPMPVWVLASLPSNISLMDGFAEVADGVLIDYYMLSLILLGIDPGIENPEPIRLVLDEQYNIGLYRSVIDRMAAQTRDFEWVFYDHKGAADPEILWQLVRAGVKGVLASVKRYTEVYQMLAKAERRHILEVLSNYRN